MSLIARFISSLRERSGSLLFVHDPRFGEDPVAMRGCDRSEFYRLTVTWASRIHETPDRVIMIFGHTTPMMMAAWFGAILAGRLPAFISYPNHKTTPEAYGEKLVNYRDRFGSATFIGEEEDRPICPEVLTGTTLNRLEDDTVLDPTHFPGWRGPPEGGELFLQCSSGTTGLQKAVAIREELLIAQLDGYRQALCLDPETDRIVSWLPLYHDMGLVATFLLPLLTATPVYYLDPFQWAASPGLLLEMMERYRGTLTWLPNFAFSFLCKNPHPRRLEHVRAFINCSEPVSLAAFQRFMTTHGVRADQLSVCYALAEHVFAATQEEIGKPPFCLNVDAASLRRNRVHPWGRGQALDGEIRDMAGGRVVIGCGFPLAGVEVRIESPSREVVGEIWLRGPCTVTGYYQSPPRAIDGWFPTGDLGFLHGGRLFLCGRIKDLIIQNGKNIHPQDVEAVIDAHPAVHPGRVAVVGAVDPELDTQNTYALVEPEEHLPFGQRVRIGQDLQTRLNLLCDVPVRVAMVPRGWLRKTSSGKMARENNLQRYLKGMQDAIHLCGDSHVRIFWTSATSHHNRFKGIHAYWVGLLWSENWKKTIPFFSELVTHMKDRDPLVIQAGEPECRTLFPRSPDPEMRIRQAVDAYREFFLVLRKLWPGRLAYMTGIPTAPLDRDNGDRQWPVCGSVRERYRHQQRFYAAMQSMCAELVIHFIDVCTPLLNEEGMIPPERLGDGTHLDPEWIDVPLRLLEQNFGVINLEENDPPPEQSVWDGSRDHFFRLVQRKVRDHAPLHDNPDWNRMVSTSLLDSLAIVELVTMLNQVCQLRIEPGMISVMDFESIEGIYEKFVKKK
ncbi:MAG: AMP-binding protein [Magnetococcales bacterium]|nr:AMP-binding protein [Magnetococcales bacterium]